MLHLGSGGLAISRNIHYFLFNILCSKRHYVVNSNKATLTTLHLREKESILQVSQAALRGAGEGYQVDLVTL